MNKLQELIQELCPNGVEYCPIGEVVEYEQPTKYIVSSTNYDNSYKTPVLTAGQSFVLGYTNETDGIYNASKENPVIIFDDFTGAFKWVDFPFKVKSSAMKMLLADESKTTLRYIYHIMGHIDFSSNEHKRLWIGTYASFLIPLPPLPVQREIVRILDSFTALTAELQAELQARKKQYEYYRDNLLNFDSNKDQSHKIPRKKLGDLFEFRNGLSKGKEYFGRGTPFIKYTDVYNHRALRKKDITALVECTPTEIEKLRISRGDVLFTRTSETAEDVGWSSVMLEDIGDCVFNGFSIRATPKTTELLPEYCAYCFSTSAFRQYVTKNCAFTTRASLTGNTIANYEMTIPSISVQQKIVHVLDNFEAICTNLNIGLPAEIEARQKQYEYYRDKLLKFEISNIENT